MKCVTQKFFRIKKQEIYKICGKHMAKIKGEIFIQFKRNQSNKSQE